MIASDINNPEFVGAVNNPDGRLAVMFYSKPVQNEWETLQQGRPIFKDADFVRITMPGDTLNIIDTFAREDHKARFPLQWAHYQNKHGGDPREMGTPLSQWPLLTPAQAEELKGLKFYTVEAVANASDAQLQRLGMAAGMSAYAFRDRAANFLKLALSESAVNEADERVRRMEEENARIQRETAEKLAAMQEQMEALTQAAANAKPKAKRGPKPRAGATQ